ncbi:TPR repeat region-containing protein, partial [Mycobacteroides abscessus]
MSARSYQLLLSTPTKANIELMRQAMVAGVEIQQTGADYKTAVERPGGEYWDGAAADAARETASSDEKVFLGAGQAILNGAPNVIDSLSRELEQQNATIALHDQATGDHYKIADDLTVEWDAPKGASDEQIAKGKEYAANIQARLQRMYDAWGAADLEAASQTDAMDLDTLLAPVGGLDAARGNEDGSALQGGYIDPELIKRVRAASVLSPEQVDALAAGKSVTIPSNQMQYLYQLSRSLDGKTPAEVNAFLNGIGNPQDRTAVKDALAMVSNKNIRSGIDNKAGVTEATRGNFIPTAGSVSNLPDGVREALTRADRVGVSFDN